MKTAKLRIGQVGSQVRMSPAALRYYEDEGLIDRGERTDAGYRLSPPARGLMSSLGA